MNEQPKFKVGDTLQCIIPKGLTREQMVLDDDDNPLSAGHGWHENWRFVVRHVSKPRYRYIYWDIGNGRIGYASNSRLNGGVFEGALRLVNPQLVKIKQTILQSIEEQK